MVYVSCDSFGSTLIMMYLYQICEYDSTSKCERNEQA